MTVTQVLDYVRRLHNEINASTPNWSDAELYALIEAKCNEVLSIIGLIEAKDTSTTTVDGQSDYDFPSGFIRIRRLWYDNRALKYLGFRQYEARMPTGVMSEGTPREFTLWNEKIILIPTPNEAKVLTIFGEKQQTSITSASSTIEIPSVFHPAICDAVISEMFVKDENVGMAQMYQQKWMNFHIPAMRKFAKDRRRRGLPSVVIDADSSLETEFGII